MTSASSVTTATNLPGAPLLEIQGLSKAYGTTRVLNDCHLVIRAGEIHALLGGNGAGKSTLVRIMAGLVPITAGAMTLAGERYMPASKRDAERAGIEIVQQEFNLLPTLTVAENLLLSRLPAWGGVIQQGELQRRAQAALDRLELQGIDTQALVETLGVGQQQMVEIAAALDRKCRLLILDEPTAALSVAEAESLFRWLQRLRKEGVAIVYISHRLDEVARLADHVTILRDGQCVGTYEASTLDTTKMVALMTGQEDARVAAPETAPRQSEETPWALRVEGLCGGMVKQVSLQVRAGERLGIAGLVGSGRTELLRLIFGADRATAGSVRVLNGPPRLFHHPSQAVAAGIAMVTEDRKQNGLLLSQAIRVNSTLAGMRRWFSCWGLVRSQAEIASAEHYRHSLETRCTSIEQAVGTLSGGNQQKVVLAKWLTMAANVFLFDEPTRGIDVPARQRIYRLLESLAAEGKGMVIVSSDLEELLETCDRIAVMSCGRLVETFSRDQFSREAIMQAAFSGHLNRSGVS